MVRMLMQTVFTRADGDARSAASASARPRASADSATMAVGFVDLVGFTTFAHHVSTAELADVASRFEEAAYDIVAARDGRVVKLIGDEVMFVTRGRRGGVRRGAARPVRSASRAIAAVTPRGGIALGELLAAWCGDYYGPIMNLAARVAQIAVPHELLVTTGVADAVGRWRPSDRARREADAEGLRRAGRPGERDARRAVTAAGPTAR